MLWRSGILDGLLRSTELETLDSAALTSFLIISRDGAFVFEIPLICFFVPLVNVSIRCI